MTEWIGPDGDWPTHSKPFWKESLGAARRAGWNVMAFKGHNFGRAVCRIEPTDNRCELLIFSTGKGSETVALELKSMVARCPHGPARQMTAAEKAMIVATQHVESAEKLLAAALACRVADVAEARFQELMELAFDQLDHGEREATDIPEWDEASEQQHEADGLRQEAQERLASAGQGSDATAESVLAAAERASDVAEAALKGVARKKRQTKRALLKRIQALRDQLLTLRDP